MAEQKSASLIGRIAVQPKLITMDQLNQATAEQGQNPEKRLGDIRAAIQTGAALGMCLLEQSLNELVRSGTVTRLEALRHAEEIEGHHRLGGFTHSTAPPVRVVLGARSPQQSH